MAFAEIDRQGRVIRLIYPTNESVKKIQEWEDELNNYSIEIIPQNTITEEQMRLCYVLFKQFGEALGYTVGEAKELLKDMYSFDYDIGEFSLSPNKRNTLTLEQATEFIQFIIETAINENINLYIYKPREKKARHIREIVPDIERYVIACLRNRCCAVCGVIHDFENGKIVELHHYDSVASVYGIYENDDGLQGRYMSLCRNCHIKYHNVGQKEFEKLYHIEGVFLNPQLVFDLLPVYKNHFKKFRREYKEGKYGNLEKGKGI